MVSLCVTLAFLNATAARAGDSVLTESARSEVAEKIARSQTAQPSPTAERDARVRSRTAFRRQSAPEARQALLASHPALASQPGWLALPSPSPFERLRPLGPNLFSVDGGGRPDSVVLTTQPVAFRDKAGYLRTIDLGLERNEDQELVPRRSPFPLSLPAALSQGISAGDGDRRFSITPTASNGGEASGVIERYAAFYGNVDPDTDFVVKPVLGGVETFSILRSPTSPEVLRLNFSGGAGSKLRPMGENGFVLSQGDEDLAAISPPKAWDAQHRPIAVEVSAESGALVMRVAHRDRDVSYPIVVDPTVVDTCAFFTSPTGGCQVDAWESSTDPTYSGGAYGWAFEGPVDGRYAPYAGPGYLGNGLYIRNMALNYFWNGEAGDWYYRAPAGVRIYQAHFTNLSQDNTPDNATCLFVGVLGNVGNWEPGSPRTYCAQQSLDQSWWWAPTGNPSYRGAGTEGNAAVFGAMASRSGWSSYFMDHMGGVAIGLQEMDYPANNPYLSSPDFPDSWQGDPNRSVAFHAGDAGLGIRTIAFSSPENPQWQPINADTGATANKTYYACTGGTRLACPKDVWIRLKLGDLRPGYSTIRVRVTDIVGKSYTYEHAIGISYLWSSSRYGGADGAINTTAEINAFLSARDPKDNAATVNLWAGAAPADQELIAAFIEEDEWNPSGIDEDDQTVEGGVAATEEPTADDTASILGVYEEQIRDRGGALLARTPYEEVQSVARTTCPANDVGRRNHKIFRMVRKAPTRAFANPAVRYHVQINAKPQDIPWVEGAVVTTWFTHPDSNRRLMNRVPRPSPGKPAYYSHSNSHVKPGTRFRYETGVIFRGEGLVVAVRVLPDGTRIIRYLKRTGYEGSCIG